MTFPDPHIRRRRSMPRRLAIPADAARRKFLSAFGFAFLAIGLSYMTAAPATPVRVALLWTRVPFWMLGLMWAVCGLVAVVSSFLPTPRDKAGFICLSIPPTLWAIVYLVAHMLVLFNDYYAPRAWVSVIVFGLIAYAVDVVSGMVDARLAAKLVEGMHP